MKVIVADSMKIFCSDSFYNKINGSLINDLQNKKKTNILINDLVKVLKN